MTVRFLHLHFKFTFTFTFHPFTTTEYYLLLLLLLLSPDNLFTFLPFYFFTFKRVPTQPLLHRDAIFRTSRRSHRYVVTQFQMHREGVKNIRMQAAIPRDALSDSSNIFLSYSGLLIFCPCVRQQYKM